MSIDSYVLDCYWYDWESGALRRKRGGKVGCTTTGYVRVNVMGKSIPGHHIVWFLVNGVWPADQLDHINGDTLDNRIENLRQATAKQNQENVTKRRDNKSGFLGVCYHRATGKWVAQISNMGRKHYLGVYDSASDASESYELAKFALHRFQPHERKGNFYV